MPAPWLDLPIALESPRDDMCMMTPEECEYRSGHYRYWFIADWVYGMGTIYFFIATIAACMLGFWFTKLSPPSLRRRLWWQKLLGGFRYLAYRRHVVAGYTTHSLGVMALLLTGAVFFLTFTLGPAPYYWPSIDFGSSPPIATRAGWMALACLPFILILSTKANMIATLTGVSHEKLIVFHNWTSWAMFVLSLVHTFPFIIVHLAEGDMVMQWNMAIFYWTGVVCLIAQAYLQIMSLPFIRNRFYEFFKATHFAAALIFVLFLFFHCDYTLTAWNYFIAAGVLYTLMFLYTQARVFFEFGLGLRATFDLVSDTTMRITIPVRTTWEPTQHMFLRFLTPNAQALTAHPFTVCSVPTPGSKTTQSKLVFYVETRGGITAQLAKLSAEKPGHSLRVLMDGPYGGIKGKPLRCYDDALVVACGAGAAFSLGLVMDSLLHRSLFSTTPGAEAAALPRMRVLLATRDPKFVKWYREALSDFIEANHLPPHLEGIEITVFLTNGDTSKAAGADVDLEKKLEPSTPDAEQQPSITSSLPIECRSGRPDFKLAVQEASLQPGTSLAVVACGPSGVLSDVQAAAADAQVRILQGKPGAREVYLHCESFSW